MIEVITAHAHLGAQLKGVLRKFKGEEVVQYRGVPYATIARRFDFPQPIPISSTSGYHDFTDFGPICPQADVESERLAYSLPDDQEIRLLSSFQSDELKCLNLIVTAPRSVLEGTCVPVPVMLYIPGGAFARGTANKVSEDPSALVAESAKLGRPMVVVSINYRINLLGFSPIPGRYNLGLHDQIAALKWVRSFISAFGGDPDRVTLAGQSAGAISAHLHLHAPISDGLFKRVVLMSGLDVTSPPRDEKRQDGLRRRICSVLDIDPDSDDWLDKYRNVPVKMLKKAAMTLTISGSSLTQDGILYPRDDQLKVRSVPRYCEAIMLGECINETLYWSLAVQAHPISALVDVINRVLEPRDAEKLCRIYGIDASAEPSEIYKRVLEFVSNGLYHLPITATSEAWRKSGHPAVFQYVFAQENPFEPSVGAHHQVDIMFGFEGFRFREAHEKGKAVQLAWQGKLIDFVNGNDPWEVGSTYHFGPNGECGHLERTGEVDDFSFLFEPQRIKFLRQLGQETVSSLCESLLRGKVLETTGKEPQSSKAML